jgi:hypothetical protein
MTSFTNQQKSSAGNTTLGTKHISSWTHPQKQGSGATWNGITQSWASVTESWNDLANNPFTLRNKN